MKRLVTTPLSGTFLPFPGPPFPGLTSPVTVAGVSLAVEATAPIDALRRELSAFAHVSVASELALVALVGERLKHTPGLAARVFGALASINVEMISMGSNEINLSLVVERKDEAAAVRLLHQALFSGNGETK